MDRRIEQIKIDDDDSLCKGLMLYIFSESRETDEQSLYALVHHEIVVGQFLDFSSRYQVTTLTLQSQVQQFPLP